MSEKEKKAIKVLKFMPGVESKPIDPNDPSVIHPHEPWLSWAKDGDISGGKKICEFVNWPGAESKQEEKIKLKLIKAEEEKWKDGDWWYVIDESTDENITPNGLPLTKEDAEKLITEKMKEAETPPAGADDRDETETPTVTE